MSLNPDSRAWLTLVCGAVLGFCAALATGALAERQTEAAHVPHAGAFPGPEGRVFQDVYARIKADYVEDVDDHVLMETAIRGMVTALDSHSAYLDNQELEQVRVSTMGSYPGVGIQVVESSGVIKILRPFEGSPADRAGLKADDELVSIDGQGVGADLAGALARLRGAAGSVVTLGIRHPGAPAPIVYTLRRSQVEVHSVVAATLEPGFGYVRIAGFSETTAEDLKKAILTLKRDNSGHIGGLVLDLRNNPGGVLEAGVAVADAFLDAGVIVTTDGRTPEARFEMDATPGDLIDGASMVVLVNAGSASAAEIVAGALKDHGRAVLIGRRTYGKGSVQTIMPLAHGGAVKLTTSHYFTPSGASIQGRGLTPDIVEDGPGAPPAELSSGPADAPLAARDADVRLGLDTLKARLSPGAHASALLAHQVRVP